MIEQNTGYSSCWRVSSFYETSAWGKTDQGDFYNAVACMKPNLKPERLLEALLNIEIKLGRQHGEKWGPRNIDLDILLYGMEVIDREGLRIPHPYLDGTTLCIGPSGGDCTGFGAARWNRTQTILKNGLMKAQNV